MTTKPETFQLNYRANAEVFDREIEQFDSDGRCKFLGHLLNALLASIPPGAFSRVFFAMVELTKTEIASGQEETLRGELLTFSPRFGPRRHPTSTPVNIRQGKAAPVKVV